MVLKGQVFTLDACIAVMITCITLLAFMQEAALITSASISDYGAFSTQRRLLDASEALVASAGYPRDWSAGTVQVLGLAKHEENTVKHHELDMNKIRSLSGMGIGSVKRMLGLEGLNISLSIKTGGESLLSIGDGKGYIVRRIALCEEEVCVLELQGA